MAAERTLDGILGEIQYLVVDQLQVVSYKWLSRKFSVSSNDAKRLLREFVMKYGSGLEAIYTLSGWLKKDPGIYNVRLVCGSKLTDAKQEFLGNYSVQVYSVQTCIPKDPAVLWSSEFVQAEELFDLPSTADNCLRDNRFCGVTNSFVKHITNGKSIAGDAPKTKIASGIAVTSKMNGLSRSFPTHQGQTQHSKTKTTVQTSAAVNMQNNNDTAKPMVNAELSKAQVDKEKASGPFATKKVANEKAPQGGNVGSLANLWGRASAKSKPESSKVDKANDISKASAATSDAQICAHEALGSISSDDEGQNVSCNELSRGVVRKRRVVFDFSDDEDEGNIVSLASPEPTQAESSKKGAELVKSETNLNFENQMRVEVKQENTSAASNTTSTGEFERPRKNETSGNAVKAKAHDVDLEKHTENKKREPPNNYISTSPKRKKILKTRIDERGREVTEVVWEGDAAETNVAMRKTDTVPADNGSENRLPPADKPAASRAPSNPTSKPGNTKPNKSAKDSKQANILSFFKKV